MHRAVPAVLGGSHVPKGVMKNALVAIGMTLRQIRGHRRAWLGGLVHACTRRSRWMDRTGLLAVLTLASVAIAAAQPAPIAPAQAEEVFRRGVAEFTSGEFTAAAATFDALLTSGAAGERETAALIMRAKALLFLDDNMETARVVRRLLTDHPASRYVADAHFILGTIFQRIGRREDALAELTTAWETMPQPEPPRLAEDIIGAMDSLTSSGISRLRLASTAMATSSDECRAFLRLKIAENEAAAENMLAARQALDTLLSLFPARTAHPRVAALRNRIAERSDVHLGVLLPLMQNGDPSAAREIAHDVHDGIRFAVDAFSADPETRVRVTLVPFDTERDPATAERGVRQLAADPKLVAIIGPVFSSSTVSAARAAEAAGVPLISPTANANGIAGTGPNIFQANPDYAMRGKAMARYAVEVRGFRRLAVLAPSDSYGRFLAQAFTDEAERLGARVIAAEWYERKTSDLKKQLRTIRRAGLHAGADPMISFGGKKKLGELMKLAGLGVPVRTLDSLMHRGAMVSATALVGPDAAARLDSIGISVVYDDLYLDSLDVPVTAIEGLYLPVSTPEEIGVVTSQVVYFNIRAQLLGSGEWNTLEELDANRRYCSGVVFESDSYADSVLAANRSFIAGYTAAMKKAPSRHAFYGYDTASLVLERLRQGSTTRGGLRRALAETTAFQGLHARIGFSPGRVNMWLPILQFDGRTITGIHEIKAE